MSYTPQTPIIETWHEGGFIVSQSTGHRYIDPGLLTGGARVLAGTVLGQQTTGNSATSAALGGNTGNGTMSAVTTVATPAQIGAYNLLFSSATAFTVTAPNGQTAAGAVGSAFSALGIGFTITAGGTAFAANDSFSIAVTASEGKPSAVATAGASNVGNGTCSAVTTTGYAPKVGTYNVVFDGATEFTVTDPSGLNVGHGVTGTAFSGGGLNFTITAGGTAFAPGDGFVITVAAGSGNWVTSVSTAVDGSQFPAGILYGSRNATNGNVECAVVTRACEVNGGELIWDPSYTPAQIAAGIQVLASLGIVVR